MEKPVLTSERQELVDKIIKVLAETKPTFREAHMTLDDVKAELLYRATHLRM